MRKIGWLNLVNKLYLHFYVTEPSFKINVKVKHWNPLAVNQLGYPQPWAAVSFSYVLPCSKCFGHFQSMQEEFLYWDYNNHVVSTTIILLDPIINRYVPRVPKLKKAINTIDHIQKTKFAMDNSVKSSKSNQTRKINYLSVGYRLTANTTFFVSLNDFWFYNGKCHVYDGRWYTDHFTHTKHENRSVCAWALNLKNAGLVSLITSKLKTVSIIVGSADFFNHRVNFCGLVFETFTQTYFPYIECFIVDNNPINNEYYNLAETNGMIGDLMNTGTHIYNAATHFMKKNVSHQHPKSWNLTMGWDKKPNNFYMPKSVHNNSYYPNINTYPGYKNSHYANNTTYPSQLPYNPDFNETENLKNSYRKIYPNLTETWNLSFADF